ncbi:MAG: hypothetical protein PVJ15_01795 [Gammaproteobacteria bacterium]|jgi:hypothetical protein
MPRWLLQLISASRVPFACLVLISFSAHCGVVLSTDEQTGLAGWHLTENGLEVELVQRLPDQTRAFFLARGFPAAVADEIAVSCIFQTIVRNAGSSTQALPVSVDLALWRILHAGREDGIRLKEAWMNSWPRDKVSEASRLAFRWATFPTRQEFLPGDYNWGMTAFGLAPGEVFDLKVVWLQGSQARTAWIRDVECAPDVDSLRETP